jgi:hypothetical protein
MRPMALCIFRGRAPAENFALTALNGEPRDPASRRRTVFPLCPHCHRALAVAVAEGRSETLHG